MAKGKIVKGPHRVADMGVHSPSGRVVMYDRLHIQAFSMGYGAQLMPSWFLPGDLKGLVQGCRNWIRDLLEQDNVSSYVKAESPGLLMLIEQLAQAIEQDTTAAIILAAKVGVTMQWLAMQPADRPADVGRRQIVNSAKGVEIQHSNIKNRHEEMRKHWAKIRPDCRSDHAADSQTAGEFGVSAKTIQRVRAK